MNDPKPSIKRDRIALNIAHEYKLAYKGTHDTTRDKVYRIIRWLSKNTDSILVIMGEQEHYSEVRKIYKRLSDMELVQLFQAHTSEDRITRKKTIHRTGIFLSALTMDRFKSKSGKK
jgi:hypothetical protein